MNGRWKTEDFFSKPRVISVRVLFPTKIVVFNEAASSAAIIASRLDILSKLNETVEGPCKVSRLAIVVVDTHRLLPH